MREYADPDECAERLVQLALRGGGPDNITVIVADVTDADIVEGRPVVGGAAATRPRPWRVGRRVDTRGSRLGAEPASTGCAR